MKYCFFIDPVLFLHVEHNLYIEDNTEENHKRSTAIHILSTNYFAFDLSDRIFSQSKIVLKP